MKPITFNFEQGTVIYTEEHSIATGKVMPKLSIQLIDAYRYQRELTLEYRYLPGDAKKLFWECRAYRHAGVRQVCKLPAKTAIAMIERILFLCEHYPIILFNDTIGYNKRPRAEGFVHFHERLLQGETPTAKLID